MPLREFLTAFEPTLEVLEGAIAPPMPDETIRYGYRPLPLIDFHAGLGVIGPANGKSFLDVGSGIGTKLALARQLRFRVSGIERYEPYAAVSRRLWPDIDVDVIDAFSYSDYDQFDVVYLYRPMVTPDMQRALNGVISQRLRRGALFFAAGGPYPDDLEHVGGEVWRRS